MPSGHGHIDKLDFPSSDSSSRERVLHSSEGDLRYDRSRQTSVGSLQTETGFNGRFFERVAENIQARDRKRIKREVLRYFSFFWAIISWYVGSKAARFRSSLIYGALDS